MTFWFFLALMLLFWRFIAWLFSSPPIKIVWSNPMANPIVGKPSAFVVVGFGSNGTKPFPLVDPVTVTTDNGTATVNADGTGGVFTPAVAGPFTLSAQSGAFSAVVSGTADAVAETLAGIEIQFA